jgi:hypothetical protein
MTGDALSSEYVLEQYEALRREALASAFEGARGHGLALFLGRGMTAWLAALRCLVPPSPPRRALGPAAPGSCPLPPARAELTTLLAGMVLACTREPARC